MLNLGTTYGAIQFTSLHLHPVLFQIGPFALRWYSLAYIAGIIGGWIYLRYLLTQPEAPLSHKDADDLLTWLTVGIIAGGRLAYVVFYDSASYIAAPLNILKLWQGGMSFHGGALGVSIAIILFARRRRLNWLRINDYIAMCAPIGLFLGRIANFINGELWGAPTKMPWGVIFPSAGPLPRHPSQLYEATLEGPILFLILWLAFRFTAARRQSGMMTGLFLVFYGIFRFGVEFIREPDAQLAAFAAQTGLHMGQWLSLPMICAGVALCLASMTGILASKRKNSFD